MSKSGTINIFVKRTGSQLTVPVTDKTTIAELIAYTCKSENLPREQYQLSINDTKLLKEKNTVAGKKLFNLNPTDRIMLTKKGSYRFIEAQMSSKLHEELIAALTDKAKAQENKTAIDPTPKLQEKVENPVPKKRTEAPPNPVPKKRTVAPPKPVPKKRAETPANPVPKKRTEAPPNPVPKKRREAPAKQPIKERVAMFEAGTFTQFRGFTSWTSK